MNAHRILVAGIGNIFLGDDAFGVEVVRRLADRKLPPDVAVIDFGTKGIDLMHALRDGYDTVILVNAVPCGHRPGTLYVIEPEMSGASEDDPPDVLVAAHDLDPANVLRIVERLGGQVERLLLVGCEPAPLDADDTRGGLSDAVAATVERAVSLVLEFIESREVCEAI